MTGRRALGAADTPAAGLRAMGVTLQRPQARTVSPDRRWVTISPILKSGRFREVQLLVQGVRDGLAHRALGECLASLGA